MRRADREITDSVKIKAILERADVLRIAIFDGNEPYIVTLNFGYETFHDNYIFYMHCANDGRKIDILKKFPRVCFEMDVDHALSGEDDACSWGMSYKSIIGYGNIEIITDTAEKNRGLSVLMDHYDKTGKSTPYDFSKLIGRTTILKLTTESISCKIKSEHA